MFGDMTLVGDRECEQAVIDELTYSGLDMRVITEEHRELFVGDKDQVSYIATIDGLDGSSDYQRHRLTGRHATMLAIFGGNNPTYGDCLFAGIYEHTTGNLYYADNSGSFVLKADGSKDNVTTDKNAQLAPGALILLDQSYSPVEEVARRRLRHFNTRTLNASAAHFIDVATGKAIADIECTRKRNLEFAAAYFFLKQAGGAMVTMDGEPLGNRNYLGFAQDPDDHQLVITAATPELAEAVRTHILLENLENKAKLLVAGVWGPDEVHTNPAKRKHHVANDLWPHIEQIWQPKADRGFTAGPLVRVNQVWIGPDGE